MLKFSAFDHLKSEPFDYLTAKSGQRGQEGWLPVGAHLFDAAGVMELLVERWSTEAVLVKMHLTKQEWARVCVFLALVHDIGKCTSVFQSKITAQIPELNSRLWEHGIEVPGRDAFLDPGKTPHGLSGEAILLHLGCPSGIAAVVGAHHGRPQELARMWRIGWSTTRKISMAWKGKKALSGSGGRPCGGNGWNWRSVYAGTPI